MPLTTSRGGFSAAAKNNRHNQDDESSRRKNSKSKAKARPKTGLVVPIRDDTRKSSGCSTHSPGTLLHALLPVDLGREEKETRMTTTCSERAGSKKNSSLKSREGRPKSQEGKEPASPIIRREQSDGPQSATESSGDYGDSGGSFPFGCRDTAASLMSGHSLFSGVVLNAQTSYKDPDSSDEERNANGRGSDEEAEEEDHNFTAARAFTIQQKTDRMLHELEDMALDDEEEVFDDECRQRWETKLNTLMGVVILVNAIIMGIELDYGPEEDASREDRAPWMIIESIFIVVFVLEIIIRMYWEKRNWIYSWWNLLDFTVVAVALVETYVLEFVNNSGGSGLEMVMLLRIVRLVRLVRVVKLVRAFRSLYVTVMAFKDALESMANICLILVCGLFICSIFTVQTIGHSERLRKVQMGTVDGAERFGTIPKSMYSLFELMTLEGWEVVGRPLVKAQPAFAVFLGAFIMIFTFGLLNMIIAIVVEKTMCHTRAMEDLDAKEAQDLVRQELLHMKTFFEETDTTGTGLITRRAFEEQLIAEQSVVAEHLEKVGIPTGDAKTLFNVIDSDLSGSITFEELLAGCARIKGAAGSMEWDMLTAQASIRLIVAMVKRVHKEQIKQRLLLKKVTPSRSSFEEPPKMKPSSSRFEEPPQLLPSSSVVEYPSQGTDPDVQLPCHSTQPALGRATSSNVSAMSMVSGLSAASGISLGPGHEMSIDHDSDADSSPQRRRSDASNKDDICAAVPIVYTSMGTTDNHVTPPVAKPLGGSEVRFPATLSSTMATTAQQTAFQAELLARLEADAVARAAQHDILLRLEARSQAQAATQLQIVERLQATSAVQDEIMKRLESLEAQSTADTEIRRAISFPFQSV